MNIIKLTPNAERFLSFIPALDIALSVKGCFKGLLPWPGVSIPNIYEGVKRLDEEIEKCKRPLREQNDTLCQRLAAKSVISAFHHNLDFLIENCSVYLATSEDIGKNYITVKDIFTEKEKTVLIEYPENSKEDIERIGECKKGKIKIEHDSIKDPDYLGLYLPATGSIVLFIDRIFKHVEANLLFQKVLLHEFIHALLDITPRLLKPDGTTITSTNNQSQLEETYDNTLVLYVYHDWSMCLENSLAFIDAFIKNQHKPYCDAIECYKEEYEVFQKELTENLLSVKMQTAEEHLPKNLSTFTCNAVYGNVDYSISGQDDNDDEEARQHLNIDNETFFNQITAILDFAKGPKIEYLNQGKPEFICRYNATLEEPRCELTITRMSQSLCGEIENSQNEIYCTIFIILESENSKIVLYHTKADKPETRISIQSTKGDIQINDIYGKLVDIVQQIHCSEGDEYSLKIPDNIDKLESEARTVSNLTIIEKII